MKKGFTLVELSIVLVIVGLLIGGVLIGQSLVNSVKLKSVISQLEQYHILTATFDERYQYLPGDLPTAGLLFAGQCGGNCQTNRNGSNNCANGKGTGVINQNNGGNQGELRSVMCHLSRGIEFGEKFELAPQTGSNNSDTFWEVGVHHADTAFDDVGLGYRGSGSSSALILGKYRYGLGLGRTAVYGNPANNQTLLNGAFTPEQALTIDKKIDDGLASSGEVRAGNGRSNSGNFCLSGNSYLVDFSDEDCYLSSYREIY